MTVTDTIAQLGLELPTAPDLPPGFDMPFSMVRKIGARVVISGHVPLNTDGALWPHLGKVGEAISVEEAKLAARQVVLTMLASLNTELGSLDRIEHWVRLFGMVNAAPGFTELSEVINGGSDLLIKVFGPKTGAHARSAIGVAELPFNVPVEMEGELILRD